MSETAPTSPTSFVPAESKPKTARKPRPAKPAGEESALDRRRGPGRRRTDYRRDAEEGHMNEEQLEFIKAVDEYKRANQKPFPTWTEVLDLLLFLGYRKVAPVGEFALTKSKAGLPEEDADGDE